MFDKLAAGNKLTKYVLKIGSLQSCRYDTILVHPLS